MKKLPYIQPELCVVELMLCSPLLQISVSKDDEETEEQW